jgi:hypothetical protein
MSRPDVLTPATGAGSHSRGARDRTSRRDASGARSEVRQPCEALIVAGLLSAMLGVTFYCVASLVDGPDVGLATVVLDGVAPAARAGLVAAGAGALMWLVGSMLYLGAAVDADDAGRVDEGSATRRS